MSGFFVQGLVLPPPEETGQLRGARFNKEEISRTLEKFKGRAVCDNHRRNTVVGSVMGFDHQPNGDIYANLFVDDSTVDGKRVVDEIKTGKKRGLSIGVDWPNHDHKSVLRFSDVEPMEISIVEEGAVPRSRIVAFGNSREISLSQSGWREVLELPHTQIVKMESTPPAALIPSETQVKEHASFVEQIKKQNITQESLPRYIETMGMLAQRGITAESVPAYIEAMDRVRKEDDAKLKAALDGPNSITQYAAQYLSKEEYEAYSKMLQEDVGSGSGNGMARFSVTASAVANYREKDRECEDVKQKYNALLAERKAAESQPIKVEERKVVVPDGAMRNRALIAESFKKVRFTPSEPARTAVVTELDMESLKHEALSKKPVMFGA